MKDKKNLFDLDYDGFSKTIRILPTPISHGKSYYTMSMKWQSEEDRKRDLRKRKIKNILNGIDI